MKDDLNFDKHFENFLNDLEKLIAIPSVLDESAKSTPFGEDIQKALEKTLEIAGNLGYKTYIDPKGYYGYAEIGEGDKTFGVLGHIDVVPAGDLSTWNSDPFKLLNKDGFVYGRGVQDDKGPVLLSLHALKVLLDAGYKLTQKVRFIFGTDEENLWRCLKRYEEIEEMPYMAFTPDSTFPLIYAEKGLLQVNLTAKENIDFEFTGGNAYNAVPPQAEIAYSEKIENNLKDKNVNYKIVGDKIEVIGKSVHTKIAHEGINAITQLAKGLFDKSDSSSMLKFLLTDGSDPNGKHIFGDINDEHSGPLTFNIGKADFKKDIQKLGVDIRIPVTYDKDKIVETLSEVVKKYGFTMEQHDYLRSLYVPLDSKLVLMLMKAYQESTGDYDSKPIASGGATYARTMENCVAFGPSFPGGEKTEHQPNERIGIDVLKKAMKVYIKAFELLVMEVK